MRRDKSGLSMNNDNLYIRVKKEICEMIYNGVYGEGEKIPPERVLAEELNVSRVTIRKALQLLEGDNLIVREVGSGTSICFHNTGHNGSLEMITLVAPARNPFFSDFIEAFQKNAEKNSSLVLFAQKPENDTIENCLYRLYQKDLYNAVVWLEDMNIDIERLKRLRSLGMNMVFFDTDMAVQYADCVFLDNKKAVETLCQSLKKRGHERLGYIGWDKKDIFSVREREQAFLSVESTGKILQQLPWDKRKQLDIYLKDFFLDYSRRYNMPDALVCADGENGIAVSKALRELKMESIKVAAVDEFADSKANKITTYGQDFKQVSEIAYDCLKQQNSNSLNWKPGLYKIEGNLTER